MRAPEKWGSRALPRCRCLAGAAGSGAEGRPCRAPAKVGFPGWLRPQEGGVPIQAGRAPCKGGVPIEAGCSRGSAPLGMGFAGAQGTRPLGSG